jgi:hypothetical protein
VAIQDAVAAKPKRDRGHPRKTGITKPAQKRAQEAAVVVCSVCC